MYLNYIFVEVQPCWGICTLCDWPPVCPLKLSMCCVNQQHSVVSATPKPWCEFLSCGVPVDWVWPAPYLQDVRIEMLWMFMCEVFPNKLCVEMARQQDGTDSHACAEFHLVTWPLKCSYPHSTAAMLGRFLPSEGALCFHLLGGEFLAYVPQQLGCLF